MNAHNDQSTSVFVLHNAGFLTEAGLSSHLGVGRDKWLTVLVKELLDDALDACEAHGTETPEIHVEINETMLSVAHNGPGQDEKTITAMVFGAAEEIPAPLFFGLSRGQNGKTLKALVAALLLVDGERGYMQIESFGNLHAFEIRRLGNDDGAYLAYSMHESAITTGTRISFYAPPPVQALLSADGHTLSGVIELVDNIAAFNPHVHIAFHEAPKEWILSDGLPPPWVKWRLHDSPSPHWYDNERFRHLIGELLQRQPESTVGDFIDQFHGLANATFWGTALGNAHLFQSTRLAELDSDANTVSHLHDRLLTLMKRDAPKVGPQELGVVGRNHFYAWMGERLADIQYDSLDYVCFTGVDDAKAPYVLEVAFASTLSGAREIIAGINFTWCLAESIPALNTILDASAIRKSAPVQLLVHIASPRMRHVDRSRAGFLLPDALMCGLNEALGLIATRRRTLGCPASIVV